MFSIPEEANTCIQKYENISLIPNFFGEKFLTYSGISCNKLQKRGFIERNETLRRILPHHDPPFSPLRWSESTGYRVASGGYGRRKRRKFAHYQYE
jgi:hypothetical protein